MRTPSRLLVPLVVSLLALPAVAVTAPTMAQAVANAHPDFNGDGYADLPIPAPAEDHSGETNAGVLHILYGSSGGPRAAGSQMLSQTTAGALGVPGSWEMFGLDWAWGDIDADGYDDIAVGILGEHVGGQPRGGVQVFYGSPGGITTAGDQLLSEGLPGFPGAPQDGDMFGFALAMGDYDGNGFSDLAVGNPGEKWGGGDQYGTVYVFDGSGGGLDTTSVKRLNQESPGVGESAGDGDRFGMSLATGNFNGDGRDDLAIGAPGETIAGHANAGVVHALYGSSVGLRGAGSELWSQSTPGVPGVIAAGDAFGMSLAVGRFDGDARDDLAIGASADSVGAVAGAGSVLIMRGWENGLIAVGSTLLSYASPGVAGAPASGNLFGATLASGDFDGDGHSDLAVGVPARSTGALAMVGEVVVLGGGAGMAPLTGSVQQWNQNVAGIGDTCEIGDMFGLGLTAADFNHNGRADLFIGAPGENFSGLDNPGLAHVLFGKAAGLSATGSKIFTQNTPGIPDTAESGDIFGDQRLA